VRRDADFAQLGHRLLGRLGLQLAGGLDEGDVGDVQENGVVVADAQGKFPNGLQKRQTFNVPGRAADLGDDDIGLALVGQQVDAMLNLIGDVGNDLDGFAQIIAAPLLVQDGLVHLPAGEVVHAGELDVGEALVMAEVQIGFRAVVQDIDLAMLIRIHGAGIHVEVGIEFLQRDLQAAVFEQRAERGRGQPLAEGTDHAACDKNKFHE